MGTCGFGACEACNLSEYNQTFEFKIIVTNGDKALLQNSFDFDCSLSEDPHSWGKFQKLLESDRSWDFGDKETGDRIN